MKLYVASTKMSVYDGAEYKVAVEGKVIQRAECRPVENAGYMALKRWVVWTAAYTDILPVAVWSGLWPGFEQEKSQRPGLSMSCFLLRNWT